MGVPADQLGADARGDLPQAEALRFAGDLGVQHHLQQQVAQLFGQVRIVAVADGIGHLVGLLQHVGHQRGVGLLQVPRAAALGIAQLRHHRPQLIEGGPRGGRRRRCVAGGGPLADPEAEAGGLHQLGGGPEPGPQQAALQQQRIE